MAGKSNLKLEKTTEGAMSKASGNILSQNQDIQENAKGGKIPLLFPPLAKDQLCFIG
jgi:hypothetical protein